MPVCISNVGTLTFTLLPALENSSFSPLGICITFLNPFGYVNLYFHIGHGRKILYDTDLSPK